MSTEEVAHRWAAALRGRYPSTAAPEGHTAWCSPGSHWQGGDVWRFRCECGAFGTPRPTFEATERDRQDHWLIISQTTLF